MMTSHQCITNYSDTNEKVIQAQSIAQHLSKDQDSTAGEIQASSAAQHKTA